MFRVERVIGGTESEKKRVLEKLAERFEFQDHDELLNIETEKSPEVLKAIDTADKASSVVLEKYGIESGSISASKIHLIRKDAWPSDDGAQFIFDHQCVLMPEGEHRLKQAYRLTHELFHFKSYQAAQVLPDERMDYRVGLTVETRDGTETNLTPLNEAITEDLAVEAYQSDLFQSVYAEEIEASKNIKSKYSELLNENGEPLFNDQTFYAELGPELQDGSHDIFTSQFTYQRERQGLQFLLKALLEKNRDEFDSEQDIKKLFVQSAFNGDLIKIGKLIERSFGTGTFRILAEAKSADEFLEAIDTIVKCRK